MSYINAFVRCIFGRTVGPDQAARAMAGSNAQTVQEQSAVAVSRVMKGPQRNGHFSFHVSVGAGSGPTGTLTVWYSNLPNPDPDTDAHWVQDTSIVAIDLAVVANTFVNVGNVNAEHIRFKANRTAGTIALWLWARVEGVEV